MGTLWQRLNNEEGDEEIPTKGTLEEYKRFVKSSIWQDFIAYIEVSLEDGRDLLETTYDERSVLRTDEAIRGGNEMLRRVAAFPYVQINELTSMEEANTSTKQSKE